MYQEGFKPHEYPGFEFNVPGVGKVVDSYLTDSAETPTKEVWIKEETYNKFPPKVAIATTLRELQKIWDLGGQEALNTWLDMLSPPTAIDSHTKEHRHA